MQNTQGFYSCENLPERVFGSAGAFWMKSGVAIGPIFSLTGKENTQRGKSLQISNHSNQYNSNDLTSATRPKRYLFRPPQPVPSPSLFSSPSREGVNSRWSLRLTKQYRHSPFTLWGRLTTAASATDRWPIRAASTSAVLIR